LSTSSVLAFAASGAPAPWRSRFSGTPAFLFDRIVTLLCEIQ
jgi:hypothetical protein